MVPRWRDAPAVYGPTRRSTTGSFAGPAWVSSTGALSTASRVVFYGNMQGELKAVNAEDGDILWRFQTGSGISQGPITYEVGGKQYVAVASGHLLGPPSFMGETGQKILQSAIEGGPVRIFLAGRVVG